MMPPRSIARGARGHARSKVAAQVKENRTSEERRSRLIESLKTEAETEITAGGAAQVVKGYRYPRSRWSAPAQ